MIKENELLEAIAECQGERNPNASTCRNLAAFYTILDHMQKPEETQPNYSYDLVPQNEVITLSGESDFLQKIYGKDVNDILPIIDELMDTLQLINPRLYDGVMRKL